MPELFAVAAAREEPTETIGVQSGDDLRAYQGQYRGLRFGEGTEYHIEGEIAGLLESIMRSGDRPVPRGHGSIQGPDYAEPRRVIFPLLVVGTPHSDELQDRISLVRSTFLPTPNEQHDLRWNFLGVTYRLGGRVVRQRVQYGPKNAREGRYRATVEWLAADPFIYADAEHSEIVPIFTVEEAGGFDLSTELPIDMVSAILSRKNLRNEGTFPSYPLIRFQNNGSTASWVQVDNVSTGESLRVETTLATGQTLVCDMHGYVRSASGPHIHIDEQSRFGDWQHPRTPFQLQSGDNLIEFTTDGTDVVCRFSWRDTWL